jgi:hypothetical protein
MNVCIENKKISKDVGENLESPIDRNIPGYVLYNGFMDSLIRVPTIPNRTQIPQATIHSLAEQISFLFHPQKNHSVWFLRLWNAPPGKRRRFTGRHGYPTV